MTLGKAPELIALESQSLEPFNFSDQSTVLSELSRLVAGNQIRLVMTQASYQEILSDPNNQSENRATDTSLERASTSRFQDFLSRLSVLVLPVEALSEEQAETDLYSNLAQTLVNKAYQTRQRMFVVSPKQSWQEACEKHRSLQYSSDLEALLERFIGESRSAQRGEHFGNHEDALYDSYFKDEFSYAFGGLEAWSEVSDILLDCQILMTGNEQAIPPFNKLRIADIQLDAKTIVKVTPVSKNQLLIVYAAPVLVFLVLTPGEGELVWDLDDLEDGLQMEPNEWQAFCILPCEVEAILTENGSSSERYRVSKVTVDPCNICGSISLSPVQSRLGNYIDMDQC